ncbi:MAG TPA: amidohydrolase family protein [Terriglobia bacterium]|nr:amidohydrolase family protein [Terriglobia bacterium]
MSIFHHDHHHQHEHRRGFLKKSFLFLGSLAAPTSFARAARPHSQEDEPGHHHHPNPAAAPAPVPAEAKKAEEPYRIFDAHLHCPSEDGAVWQWYPVTKSFEEFVSYLDRSGVERGIINSVRCQLAKSPAEFIKGNREVARYVERYRGRFVGACVVNPLFIDEALREIEDCRKQLGFVWVGELCNYTVPYPYTIREFEMLVEQVRKLGMVLDVHTELTEMEYIIQKYTDTTIVFPHFGGSPNDIFKRLDLVAKNHNCYMDTSGAGHERVGMLEYSMKSIGADRVLFGSDFTINDPSGVIARIENSFLTEEQKRKVLSQNLDALLKRVEPAG